LTCTLLTIVSESNLEMLWFVCIDGLFLNGLHTQASSSMNTFNIIFIVTFFLTTLNDIKNDPTKI